MSDRIPNFPPVIAPVAKGINRPLWSVMIPTYNCISFLRETLQSILVQDLGKAIMQIEVVDDCSTDGDVAALVQAIGKGRINYFRQEQNKGSLRNFETCLNRSKGQLIHLLHGDDFVYPGFYQEINSLFINYPKAGAAFTNFSIIRPENSLIYINAFPNQSGILHDFLIKISCGQLLQPPAMVIKRSVYETLGSFYAVQYGEDWEMWARVASHFPVAYSPKFLAAYRYMNNGGISQQSYLTGQNIWDMIKVFNIIETYLPIDERTRLKKIRLKLFSNYLSQSAHAVFGVNRNLAFNIGKEAFKIHKNLNNLYYISKLYLKYLIGFKGKTNS